MKKSKSTIKKNENVKPDKPPEKEFEDWVRTKIFKIIESMPSLPELTVRIKFYYVPSRDIKDDIILSVNYDRVYRQVFIYVYESSYRLYCNENKDDIIHGLIHEMAHLHTDHSYQIAKERYTSARELSDINEEITEILAQYVRYYLKKEVNIFKD